MAAPARPHISPSCSDRAANCSWYAVRMEASLRSELVKRHDAAGERAVNGVPALRHSQVVSAALVTVRSSGRWVGSLLESLRTRTCTGRPLVVGGATEAKSD